MTGEDGQVQNMRDYVSRFKGEGELIDRLREAAQSCPVVDEDDEERDTSEDVCVFPPSPRFMALVVKVLASTKRKPRQGLAAEACHR